MNLFRKGPPRAPGASAAGPEPPVAGPAARAHYRRGNRLFEAKAWDQALGEWRRATQLWHPAPRRVLGLARRLAGLRAVLALLATVCALYYGLLTFFPRNPFELLIAGGGLEGGSWWERFLDTGRPGADDIHKMGVREWWGRFKRRLNRPDEGEQAGGRGRLRPAIEKRWADLLRRYGRWGPLVGGDLDYHVVAGNGLSSLGRFDEAVAVLKRGIGETDDPDRLGELYQGLANAYYFHGYLLQPDGLARYDQEQIRLSAEAYERSLEFQPRLLAMGNLGWVYFVLGRYDKAESYSLRALSYDEELHYVRLNLGLIYLAQDRWHEAFEAYRQVASRHPEESVYQGGINDLREVIRDHAQRYPFAHLMIAFLSLQKGERPEARLHLESFLAHPAAQGRWRERAQEWLEDPVSAMEN